MKISDVMSVDVATVSYDAPLKVVADKMKRRDCGAIVVVKDDRLVGMITDRDIAIRYFALEMERDQVTAESLMTREILYCFEEDDVDAVTQNMGLNKVRRLPVLNSEKRLVGIVSLGDIASHSNHYLCGLVLGDICRHV